MNTGITIVLRKQLRKSEEEDRCIERSCEEGTCPASASIEGQIGFKMMLFPSRILKMFVKTLSVTFVAFVTYLLWDIYLEKLVKSKKYMRNQTL